MLSVSNLDFFKTQTWIRCAGFVSVSEFILNIPIRIPPDHPHPPPPNQWSGQIYYFLPPGPPPRPPPRRVLEMSSFRLKHSDRHAIKFSRVFNKGRHNWQIKVKNSGQSIKIPKINDNLNVFRAKQMCLRIQFLKIMTKI